MISLWGVTPSARKKVCPMIIHDSNNNNNNKKKKKKKKKINFDHYLT